MVAGRGELQVGQVAPAVAGGEAAPADAGLPLKNGDGIPRVPRGQLAAISPLAPPPRNRSLSYMVLFPRSLLSKRAPRELAPLQPRLKVTNCHETKPQIQFAVWKNRAQRIEALPAKVRSVVVILTPPPAAFFFRLAGKEGELALVTLGAFCL